MKVKCINNYYDLQLKKDVTVGDTYNVTDDRAKQLINAKVATPTTEVVTKATPKRVKKKEDK